MKVKKFTESYNYTYEKEIIGDLFWDIWGTKLDMGSVGVTVFYPKNEAVFSIVVTIGQKVSNITYDDFFELFETLKRLNVKFIFESKQLKITSEDIKEIIEELKSVKNSKKFNI